MLLGRDRLGRRGRRLGRGRRMLGRRRALLQRAIDIVELIRRDDCLFRRLVVGRLAGALCRISLARADFALAALPAGSADVNSALALATEGGMAASALPSSLAASSARLCRWLIWPRPCRICVAVALCDVQAMSSQRSGGFGLPPSCSHSLRGLGRRRATQQ